MTDPAAYSRRTRTFCGEDGGVTPPPRTPEAGVMAPPGGAVAAGAVVEQEAWMRLVERY